MSPIDLTPLRFQIGRLLSAMGLSAVISYFSEPTHEGHRRPLAYDPAHDGGAPLVLSRVALLACQIPARRAMNLDPTVALRHD